MTATLPFYSTRTPCVISRGNDPLTNSELAREKQKAKLQAFCRLQTELWSRGWFLSASQATAMILHSVHSQRMRGIRETSAAAIASGKNPAGVFCMVLLSELQRSCGSASDLSQDIRRVKTQDLREFCSPFATGLPKPKTTTPPVLRPTFLISVRCMHSKLLPSRPTTPVSALCFEDHGTL